jgi:hypothetical protein
MNNLHTINRKHRTFASGLKAAAVVVIIGIIAAITDHALLTANVSSRSLEPSAPAAATFAPANTGSFDVPEHLRANAGEVPPHVEAF